MESCRFYLIHSRKSEEVVDGLQKFALGCENRSDAIGFFWIDVEKNIQQIQFVFGELVLEWHSERGIQCHQTNRRIELPSEQGWRKGSRSLHELDKDELFEQLLKDVREAEFPDEWSEQIKSNFGIQQSS